MQIIFDIVDKTNWEVKFSIYFSFIFSQLCRVYSKLTTSLELRLKQQLIYHENTNGMNVHEDICAHLTCISIDNFICFIFKLCSYSRSFLVYRQYSFLVAPYYRTPREAYTSPFKVTSPLLPAGPSSQRFGAPRRDEAVLAQDPLERRLAGSSSFETAQLHPRSTQRPGPRLASKAVDNPQPPSHGCRPVQLVHAEVGPQGLLCLWMWCPRADSGPHLGCLPTTPAAVWQRRNCQPGRGHESLARLYWSRDLRDIRKKIALDITISRESTGFSDRFTHCCFQVLWQSSEEVDKAFQYQYRL